MLVDDNRYYCNITWIEGVRKFAVPINTNYSATTYIKGIKNMLSISIKILNNINEGCLTFLRPDLLKGISLINMSFDIMEGSKCVGKGIFVKTY